MAIALGLLIEPAATNLVVQSQDLTQAAWTKLGCTTGTAILAPDTTATAVPVTVAASPLPSVNEVFSVTAGTNYSFSCYVRWVATDSFLAFELNDPAAGQATSYINAKIGGAPVFNLNNWTLTTNSLNLILNGWYSVRNTCKPTFTSTNTKLNFYQSAVVPAPGGAASSTPGSVIAVWGLQMEAGALPTSYIPTTTAAGNRAADVVTVTLPNATYDILVEDTNGAEFRSGTVIGAGTYTLTPRAGQLHVTRMRVWPSTGPGSLTAAQKAAIAPG